MFLKRLKIQPLQKCRITSKNIKFQRHLLSIPFHNFPSQNLIFPRAYFRPFCNSNDFNNKNKKSVNDNKINQNDIDKDYKNDINNGIKNDTETKTNKTEKHRKKEENTDNNFKKSENTENPKNKEETDKTDKTEKKFKYLNHHEFLKLTPEEKIKYLEDAEEYELKERQKANREFLKRLLEITKNEKISFSASKSGKIPIKVNIKNFNGKNFYNFLLKIAIFFAFSIFVFSLFAEMSNNQISFSNFLKNHLLPGRVKSIYVKGDKIYFKEKIFGNLDGNSVSIISPYFITTSPEKALEIIEETQNEMNLPKNERAKVFILSSSKYTSPKDKSFWTIFNDVIFYGAIFATFYFFSKTNILPKSFKKDIGNKIKKSKTRLEDVAGMKNAKFEVKEFVDFLKNRKRYKTVGARIPRGAMLVGPPGCGKTLLAKAIAGEADCSFFACSGSEFIEVFGGVGPKRVRDLFKKARENSPAIIFIDEIDALARKRSDALGVGSEREKNRTINQLLVEMDGFQQDSDVIVLASTNMIEAIDKAILRPGRFDRTITIDLPDIQERKEILKVHLKPLKLGVKESEVINKLSTLTPQFSGAELANICNEAGILAVRYGKSKIEMEHFLKSIDRVIGGIEKGKCPVTPEERKFIAYHESGHAVAAWFLEHADPLLKVTIVSRAGGILGFAQYLPNEIPIMSFEKLKDTICMALGGRVSELIFFGHLSTGAANDLEKVTQLAYRHAIVMGFNDKIGQISLPSRNQFNQSPYSEKLGKLLDIEVQKLVASQFDRTKKLLIEKKPLIEAMAKELLEKETLDHEDVVRILGPKPQPNEQYVTYLDSMYSTDKKAEKPEKQTVVNGGAFE